MTQIFTAPDGLSRCSWCSATEEYQAYHDKEWGFPVKDDKRLFEKICLESFQSGLSWRTILAKRENFRKAFHSFDIDTVARFDESDITRLLNDEGIIRHRGKIEATINNAKRAQEVISEYGSLAKFFWQYEATPIHNIDVAIRSTSPESVALAKTLKKLGWKFVGPTTVYAFFQAMGLVNDHYHGCIFKDKVDTARAQFIRP